MQRARAERYVRRHEPECEPEEPALIKLMRAIGDASSSNGRNGGGRAKA